MPKPSSPTARLALSASAYDVAPRRLFDSIAMGNWSVDGRIWNYNAAFARLLGRKPHEPDPSPVRWPEITPAEYSHLDHAALDELRVSGRCTPFAKEYVRVDGTRVQVLIGAVTDGNSPDCGVFFALDLSQCKLTSANVDAEGPPRPARSSTSASEVESLTDRQRLICFLISRGQVAKKIAREVGLAQRTVELEKTKSARRIGLHTGELLLWSVENRDALRGALLSRSKAEDNLAQLIGQLLCEYESPHHPQTRPVKRSS